MYVHPPRSETGSPQLSQTCCVVLGLYEVVLQPTSSDKLISGLAFGCHYDSYFGSC